VYNSEAIAAALILAVSGGCHCSRATTSSSGPERPPSVETATSSGVAVTSDPSPTVVEVRVPPHLSKQAGPLELSGVAYSAALGRYLLVSDDTGRKARGTRHAPWIFAMTPAGKLDREPLPIAGIEHLNDPESITAGPDGTFFVCTSYSPDKNGNRADDRAMLVHIALSGRSLSLLGRVDLRDVGSKAGSNLLQIAGLDPTGRLDIEGIAYKDGDLFIGFKSPLGADGAAAVVRLTHAVDVLHRGQVTAADVQPHARLRLAVSTPAGEIAQGVSDLLFLPDGSLFVLANSPKGLPPDGGGAAWHVAKLGAAPTLVRRFAGLKPEGAALAPDGSHILVVFDRDMAPPTFTQLDVPH